MSFITSFENHVFIASGDLLRYFKIGDTNTQNLFNWNHLSQQRIQRGENEEKELKTVDKRVVVCMCHSNVTHSNRRLLALGTNEKQVHVLEYFVSPKTGTIAKVEHIVSAVVPKAPTAMAFEKEDGYVVVGDRAGDVHRFSVLDGIPVEMAGAISMVLDVGFTRDGKRLIMADRDEKVRVMRYPQTYVIDAYCLGHTEYVKSISVENDDTVWSAGGDRLIHNWSIQDATQPKATIDLVGFGRPIRKIAVNRDLNTMGIVLENDSKLLFAYLQHPTGNCSTVQVSGDEVFLDITVIGNYYIALGRRGVYIIEGKEYDYEFIMHDTVLAKSVKKTPDAIENLFKNVTHNNQAEYEKRKAEKFEALEQKRRRLADQ